MSIADAADRSATRKPRLSVVAYELVERHVGAILKELRYGLRHEILARKVAWNNFAVLRKESVPFRSVLFQSRPCLFRFWCLIFFLSVVFNLVVFLLG